MIKTFRDKVAATLFKGLQPKKGFPQDVARAAYRKLLLLDAAVSLEDLKSPPGNQLEALKDGRTGQHSIRVNDKWRFCFIWRDADAYETEITDYH